MNDQADPRPLPPEKPLPGDCCGGGCAVCVNDAYNDELDAYQARLAAWLARHPDASGGDAR
ncbi:oxidoreductase-like domain-containing protein [Cognatilysobacter lacus]|uniref:oxidoreductase-like domain-containing protein n=1 Tax=Cognatilysobacter lacus TaxID=1643323 RepID=UPI001F4297D9|nr:oxidoreductase-like domain-containing protein [Lysobacter lacus]